MFDTSHNNLTGEILVTNVLFNQLVKLEERAGLFKEKYSFCIIIYRAGKTDNNGLVFSLPTDLKKEMYSKCCFSGIEPVS